VKGRICTVFGNQILRRVFGTERKEVMGEGKEVGGSRERRTSGAHRTQKAEQKCVRNVGP
jgi:hypothetical protein